MLTSAKKGGSCFRVICLLSIDKKKERKKKKKKKKKPRRGLFME